jgi:hypothetical protein
MQHSLYAIKVLAEQRSAELIAEAERLNRLHDTRPRQRRSHVRSLLSRFHLRPTHDAPVIDVREPRPPDLTLTTAEESEKLKRGLDVAHERS